MTTSEAIYPDHPGFKEKGGTSEEAAKKIAPTLKKNQAAILDGLKDAGVPLTADELAAHLNKNFLSVRPRVAELNRLGKIRKTGERRKNASGHDAACWIPAPETAPDEAANSTAKELA